MKGGRATSSPETISWFSNEGGGGWRSKTNIHGNCLCTMAVLEFSFFRWEHLIYQMGSHNELIKYVIKNGKVVHSS